MTCRKILEDFLDDYLAGNLSRTQSVIFQSHLALCKPCRNYLASYQRTIQLAKSTLAQNPATTPMPEELIQAILKSQAIPD